MVVDEPAIHSQRDSLHGAQRAEAIKAEARRLGFDLVGIAPAVTPLGLHAFVEWLAQGHAGTMEWMPKRAEAYAHPQSVLEGVRSLVLLGTNYRTADPPPVLENQGRVSRYAWSGCDYHDVLRSRLSELAAFVTLQAPQARVRGVVDTAPLLERDFARLAGLGWFGKNTMLLNKQLGSWFFLSALLTDLDLEPDTPHSASHCGTCTRCLEACPTDAFAGPYVLDARKCISYLTIEHRGPIDPGLREGIGEWLFGCDVCQDVCPWNRKAPRTTAVEFEPREDLAAVDAVKLLALSEDEFRRRFRHTPLYRTKRSGLLRNACLVLGNRREESAVPALSRALSDSDRVIRGAAAWALGRIGTAEARAILTRQTELELDGDVRLELVQALVRSPAATPIRETVG
jgi:epoxyqueuosine reductase